MIYFIYIIQSANLYNPYEITQNKYNNSNKVHKVNNNK